MSDWYIEPEWLRAVSGTTFYYPCAGRDHAEAIEVFGDYVTTFMFCDVNYPPGLKLAPAIDGAPGIRLVDCTFKGLADASEETRIDENGQKYRFLPPSKRIEAYEGEDGRTVTVIRRRGFGQIALSTEFAERSIGVFMHRGDSPGEGGSNLYFLANRNARYEPCGRLFDKLASRLTDRALVITDGSNCDLKSLRKRIHRARDMSGHEAFRSHQDDGTPFLMRGFHWSCVGWLSKRYGPTLVWGLTRETDASRGAVRR